MRRLGVRLAFYAAASLTLAFLSIAAAGWLLAALWLALQSVMSPAAAALYTGLVALFAALLIAFAAAFAGRRPAAAAARASASQAPGDFEAEIAARLAAYAGRDAASFISDHPGRAAATALALGFVVGASPKLRSALRELLK